MKYTKHITQCRCCHNTYSLTGKHWVAELHSGHITQQCWGIELELADNRQHKPGWLINRASRFRIHLHIGNFAILFKKVFLNKPKSMGGWELEQAQDYNISAYVFGHIKPLNAAWDYGFMLYAPFIPGIMFMRHAPEETFECPSCFKDITENTADDSQGYALCYECAEKIKEALCKPK
jgi:hypothetical protein